MSAQIVGKLQAAACDPLAEAVETRLEQGHDRLQDEVARTTREALARAYQQGISDGYVQGAVADARGEVPEGVKLTVETTPNDPHKPTLFGYPVTLSLRMAEDHILVVSNPIKLDASLRPVINIEAVLDCIDASVAKGRP